MRLSDTDRYYEHCTDTNPTRRGWNICWRELYLGKRDIQQAKALYPGFHYRHSECQESIYVFAAIGNPVFQEGDIARAYNYISRSLEDELGKARYRIIDIAEYLPIIKAANDSRIKADRDRVLFFLLVLSVLVIALVIVFFSFVKKIIIC